MDNYDERHSFLAVIVQKVIEQSGILGVIMNNQTLHAFRKKIPCLQKAFKKQLRTLVAKVENVCKSWELGPK